MRLIVKKTIHLLLALALMSTSMLSLSASPFHSCELASEFHTEAQPQVIEIIDYQPLVEKHHCACDDCEYCFHFSAQLAPQENKAVSQGDYPHRITLSRLQQNYTQYIHRRLLRPPII
ncbi:MAG TPA: hypothetical protein ENJ08_12690 [Gammaproteobacteria bacterium]|nr:hypothetical protein [Gammaproteobacteria bacterium]